MFGFQAYSQQPYSFRPIEAANATIDENLDLQAYLGDLPYSDTITESLDLQAEASPQIDFVSSLTEALNLADSTYGTIVFAPLQIAESLNLLASQTAEFLWSPIDDDQTPGWQAVDNTQTSGWTAINTTQNPNWNQDPS